MSLRQLLFERRQSCARLGQCRLLRQHGGTRHPTQRQLLARHILQKQAQERRLAREQNDPEAT